MYSWRTVKTHLSHLRMFFSDVLSVGEVKKLFAVVENLKHRCLLKMIYGSGLRLSEVTNLRIADIHSDRMQVFVRGGKGKKDRYTTLSQNALMELRKYFIAYRPGHWLFEGQHGGQYAVRSVQAVFRRSVEAAGVNPYATVHTLRHSYATHLSSRTQLSIPFPSSSPAATLRWKASPTLRCWLRFPP